MDGCRPANMKLISQASQCSKLLGTITKQAKTFTRSVQLRQGPGIKEMTTAASMIIVRVIHGSMWRET
jgi:hypothetical protein